MELNSSLSSAKSTEVLPSVFTMFWSAPCCNNTSGRWRFKDKVMRFKMELFRDWKESRCRFLSLLTK